MVSVELWNSQDIVFRVAELPFMPRVGEYLAIEVDGYFTYHTVAEVWVRIPEGKPSVACVRTKVDD